MTDHKYQKLKFLISQETPITKKELLIIYRCVRNALCLIGPFEIDLTFLNKIVDEEEFIEESKKILEELFPKK